MQAQHTTLVVQHYLDELARLRPGDAPAEPVVRELLAGAVNRLHMLCRSMLLRGYPRLTQPPLNLQAEEMLSALTERLLKALREARPKNVRQFFALANQHIRWELNDVARRLDKQAPRVEMRESFVAAAPETSGAPLGARATRIFEAIDKLPDDEREAFDLVRIQEMTQTEAAEVLGVGVRTVQRRLNRALVLLAEALPDLRPATSSSHDGG